MKQPAFYTVNKTGIISNTAFAMAFLWVMVAIIGIPGRARGFFQTSGQNIMDNDNNPFLVRGINLSGWLIPEAYILRIDRVHNRHLNNPSDIRNRIKQILIQEEDIQTFWETYHCNFVTQSDIADFKVQGFNTVRVPFNYRLLSPQDTPGVYDEAGFLKLDEIIGWCKSQGLAVILDMHACPGGQSYAPHSDPEYSYWYWDNSKGNWYERGVAVLWENNPEYFQATGRTPAFHKQRTADIWRKIAERYKDETAILGYELINEPYFYESAGVTYADMRNLFIQISSAIRQVDSNHIIIVEGNLFATSLEGLTPPWEENLVLAFHRYWTSTGLDANMQNYIDAREQNNVPLLLTETGENSHPWYFEFKQLLENNNIGWCWWGFKKVDTLTAAYSVAITQDYQYVIDNFRDSPIRQDQAKKGLMDLANHLATNQCTYFPGYYASLLDEQFGTIAKPYQANSVPGIIYFADYDMGNQGLAYYDTFYKLTEYSGGGTEFEWNAGGAYRNDGVDIWKVAAGNGYAVGGTENGEWLRYTINVTQKGNYDVTLSAANPGNAQMQIYLDGSPLTAIFNLPQTNSWEEWRSFKISNLLILTGTHALETRIIKGDARLAAMQFSLGPPPADDSSEEVEDTIAFPNPARDHVTFAWHHSATEVKIDIFNISGEQVMRIREVPADGHRTTCDLTTVAPGIYIYKITVFTPNRKIVYTPGKVAIIK